MSTLNEPPAEDGRPAPTALREPLSTIAFWSAIVLPVLYLPLLAAGLGTARDLALFLGLFLLHLATLLAGRSHGTR